MSSHSQPVHECNYNWKTFIEVYLEDYHVRPFHPGLGSISEKVEAGINRTASSFIDCQSLLTE